MTEAVESRLRAYAEKLGPKHVALRLSHLTEAAQAESADICNAALDKLCNGSDPVFRKDAILYIDDDCHLLEGEELEHLLAEGEAVDPYSGELMAPGSFDWGYEYAVIVK